MGTAFEMGCCASEEKEAAREPADPTEQFTRLDQVHSDGAAPAAPTAALKPRAISSDDDADEAPPKPLARTTAAAPRSELEKTEEELAEERRLRDANRPDVAKKVMEFQVDAASDHDDASDRPIAADDEAAVEAFEFSPAESPEKVTAGLGVGDSLREEPAGAAAAAGDATVEGAVPDDRWYAARADGSLPPTRVTWFQAKGKVHVELLPANAAAAVSFDPESNILTFSCVDGGNILGSDDEDDDGHVALKPSDVVLYTTSITASRQVRDHCRGMERHLYLHGVGRYHAMDVSSNKFMRKHLVKLCGGKDLGLPLLFVGETFIGDWDTVEVLVDNRRLLATLQEAGYKGGGVGSPTGKVCDTLKRHYVELKLFGPVRDTEVVMEGRVATFAAGKSGYWPQLVAGPSSEVKQLPWLKRDLAREEDDDDDDD